MVLDEVPPPVVVLSVTTLMSYPDGKLLVADADGDGLETLALPKRCTLAAANRRNEVTDRLFIVTLVVPKLATVASGVAEKSVPRGVT